MTGAFDGHGQNALMVCAGTGDAAWEDLAAIGYEAPEFARVLIVDPLGLLEAEVADFASGEASSTGSTASGASRAAISAVTPVGAVAVRPALA